MFKHIGTGIVFENRKQAIILMGETRYKRFLKNKEFDWRNQDDKCKGY